MPPTVAVPAGAASGRLLHAHGPRRDRRVTRRSVRGGPVLSPAAHRNPMSHATTPPARAGPHLHGDRWTPLRRGIQPPTARGRSKGNDAGRTSAFGPTEGSAPDSVSPVRLTVGVASPLRPRGVAPESVRSKVPRSLTSHCLHRSWRRSVGPARREPYRAPGASPAASRRSEMRGAAGQRDAKRAYGFNVRCRKGC